LPLAVVPGLSNDLPEALGLATDDTEATILLVEDEILLCELTALALRTDGLSVVTANDPVAAIQLVVGKKITVDVLVSDINLPRISGFELYGQLRLIFPDLNAIFMSGYPSGRMEESKILPRSTTFLEKPFEHSTLLDAVRKILK